MQERHHKEISSLGDSLIANAMQGGQDTLITGAALYYAFMRIVGIKETDDNRDTPYRYSKMMINELCSAIKSDKPEMTVFDNPGYDEYVTVKSIPYYSLCSHHHIPFFGTVDVSYHPGSKIVGLSKIARVITYFAAKPQVQEKFTESIINYLNKTLTPIGIFVRVTGRHLCMEMRGAKAHSSTTVTTAILGNIDKNEALKLISIKE